MRRVALAALVVLSLALGPLAGLAAATPSNNTTATATPTATPTATGGPSPANPKAATTVRILPVQLQPDFLRVAVVEMGQTYNTSGPFVILTLSHRVDQAAIQQPKASATVLEGGRQVLVSYKPAAAPVGKQSLYKLNLYFPDGSSRTIQLYAERTSVDVGSAQMAKYRPFIQNVLNDAEEAGYERSPEGAEKHYEGLQETAQLLNNLFAEKAYRLFMSIVGIFMNPLGIAAALLGAALLALWQLKQNSSTLEILSNDSGKAARLRERLWISYKSQQQTAADEPLRELQGVGEMGEIYWNDAFNVETVAGLAELFAKGFPVQRDGEIRHVGGVDNLDPEMINSGWIEAVCRDQRLPSAEIALSHGKQSLQRMISKYGMAHIYQDSYERTCELIDEMDESRSVSDYTTVGSSKASAGGDD